MTDQRSQQAQAWRGWYKLARWKRKRAEQLQREPLCAMCRAVGRTVAASVADHVKPHRGDPHLFWNGKLQSLCPDCHDRHKQAQERTGVLVGADADGTPLDPAHHWR
jgi:5-methylcytosine-specific restriction protein A